MSANKSLMKNPSSRLHGHWIYKNLLSQSQSWPVERREQYVLEHLRNTLVRAYERNCVLS